MTKQKKLLIIIISCVLAVALITTAIILIVANSNREKTPTSILTCSVNPQVQFVLNGNDKVMEVVALNSEGENLAINGNFVGLKAEKATELFVKLSTEAGYIEVDTEGTKVEINITGIKNDYVQLKNQVVSSINSYFDKNGIIAGAVATIDKDIKTAILTLKSSAKNIDSKNNEALMQHYMNIVELVDRVKASELQAFYNGYDNAMATYNQAIEDIDAAIDQLQSQLAATTDSNLIANLNQRIDNLQKNEKKLSYNSLTASISNLYELLRYSDQELDSIRQQFEATVNNVATKIAEHQTTFNANKASIQQKIADYRATLAN